MVIKIDDDDVADLVADLLARKEAGRLRRAQLSFGEKLGLLDEMRDLADAFREARDSLYEQAPVDL
jgi:hypothetical protein